MFGLTLRRLPPQNDRAVNRTRLQMERLEERCNPANYNVANLNDAGPGSFRAALAAANQNGDTVTFGGALNGVIDLQTALDPISKDITITGPTVPAAVTVERGPNVMANFRILNIANGAQVSIIKLTFANGATTATDPNGDGILDGGKLTLTDCTVRNNAAVGNGGGIFVGGRGVGALNAELVLNNTKVTNNQANGNGGGIAIDMAKSTLIQATSDVSNNTALDVGGGIYLAGFGLVGQIPKLKIDNSTLTNNTATNKGGGIYAEWQGAGTAVVIAKTSVNLNRSINGVGGGIFAGANTTIDGQSVVNFNKSGDPKGEAIYLSNANPIQVKTLSIAPGATIQGNGYFPPPGGGGGMRSFSEIDPPPPPPPPPPPGGGESFAVYVEDGAELILEGVWIFGNDGHGVYGHVNSLGNNYVENSLTTSDGWIESDTVT